MGILNYILYNRVFICIDVSIWLYQIIKGVQESEHGTTSNAHLIVMFHRICKLLFYGIKPIFVFDGGVPELKKLTIAQRQAQKSHAKKSVRKTKEKVLKNMLEQAALKTVMDTKNTMNEDEVITKTFNSLNKEVENDMFELPKLSESLELSIETPIREKKGKYMNSSDEDFENVLLLAVENQNNDLLYTNKAKDKEKPPAKLHAFSSLQIGELLNGYSEDQKRLSERKKQQKPKREMTFNELEMFLNDNSNTNIINEFSQKIDSDYDTVFYYESNVKNIAKSSNSNNNEISNTIRPGNLENDVIESKKNIKNIITTETIGSPTLTDDLDEDIFKALAGDESLEEDRLAWLIFNENKKASKRRSSEFELPNAKNFKADENILHNPDKLMSNNKEDICMKNKASCSKSIYITEDENNLDNCSDKDYLSWVSHSKDESSQIKLEKKEPSFVYMGGPSTSKFPAIETEDNFSHIKSDKDKPSTNNSIYFMTKTNEICEDDVFYNSSPSIQSEQSNSSFSENSVDFSSDDVIEDNKILDMQYKHMPCTSTSFLDSNEKLNSSKNDEPPFKEINSTKNTEKLKLSKNINSNSIKLSESSNEQRNSVDNQYLLTIQDTLVKQQNELGGIQITSNRMATSVTQKITSDIKDLLKLFGIPYITAPMEAEAQCVFLEKIGHTEGTVTDDSDVWLFGANVVYKDFFDSKKFVKQFKSIDIKQKFALSQNSFIQLAFLVGSDYTNGIDGIGPVSAIEILSYFKSSTKNMNIEEKLLKIKEIANLKSEINNDVPILKKLKSLKIGNDFPNKAVINAYLNPIVNESNEKFNWGVPQVDSIIQFAQINFDWDVSKTKNTLAPVLKKVSERTTQKSLHSYITTIPKLNNTNSTSMSKRVSIAVKRLKNDSSPYFDSTKVSTPIKSKNVTHKKCKKDLK